ncbi:LOW QUALITY PROTEIN: bcl-2-modifying factor-like [Pholidichthys leucotaenia]
MDDDEDNVFKPDAFCWRAAFREVKCEHGSTQTPGPALVLNNSMLPCGVAEKPRPLFYGNTGFRLHFPVHFELVGDHKVRQEEGEEQRNPEVQPRGTHTTVGYVGQKLRQIGDGFHQQQTVNQNQRNQGLPWRHVAAALLSFLVVRGLIARVGGAGRR